MVKRPTKAEIKASIDKLKSPQGKSMPTQAAGKVSGKKSSQGIRKQGSN